jgi:hypothetical protein
VRRGDLVQLRPPAEILATLDADGCTDGLPFMPEMLAFFGRPARVTARVERACDTLTWTGVRRLENTVVLDDLRCTGSGHDGCAAGCRLFWREAWLRPAVEEAAESDAVSAEHPAFRRLEELTRSATKRSVEPAGPVFRCQATELLRASTPVAWWSPVSLLREVWCGNVGVWRFVRVMAGAVADQVKRRVLRRDPLKQREPGSEERGASVGGFAVGQRVRVRPATEIASTLDANSKLRGLRFDFPEMAPHCGTEAPVIARVDRFIDENSGRMVELRSDAYVIGGCTCGGDHAGKRWFCPRAIHAWWREAWLEPLPDDGLEPAAR